MASSSGANELEDVKGKISRLEAELETLKPENPERLLVRRQLAAMEERLTALRQEKVLLLQSAAGSYSSSLVTQLTDTFSTKLTTELGGLKEELTTKLGGLKEELTTKLGGMKEELKRMSTGQFFEDDLTYNLASRALVVLDHEVVSSMAGVDNRWARLTPDSLERLQEAINGKRAAAGNTPGQAAKAAKLEPLAFNCTGVVFHEAGLIATAWHSICNMMKEDKKTEITVDDLITVFFPAFGPEKGVVQCRVEHKDEVLDFARLRMVSPIVPEGPGSYFLEVFQESASQRFPLLTEHVAVVSGRVYSAAKDSKSPPQLTVTVGCIESYWLKEVKCSTSTFPGDSGAGIVMKNGKLLAMNLGEENTAERNHGSKRSGSCSSASYSRSCFALLAVHMIP